MRVLLPASRAPAAAQRLLGARGSAGRREHPGGGPELQPADRVPAAATGAGWAAVPQQQPIHREGAAATGAGPRRRNAAALPPAQLPHGGGAWNGGGGHRQCHPGGGVALSAVQLHGSAVERAVPGPGRHATDAPCRPVPTVEGLIAIAAPRHDLRKRW